MLTIIATSVFEENGKYYPQVFKQVERMYNLSLLVF